MSVPQYRLYVSVPVLYQCIHVLKSGYMHNVCLLYILLTCNVLLVISVPLTCNVCPLYIPLT